MTPDEVGAIFGRSPDARQVSEDDRSCTIHIWEMGDNQRARIFFDARGRLFGALILDERDPAKRTGRMIDTIGEESFVDKLRQRLGL